MKGNIFSHPGMFLSLFCLVLGNFVLQVAAVARPNIKSVKLEKVQISVDKATAFLNESKIPYGDQQLKVADKFKTPFDRSKISEPGTSGASKEKISFGLPSGMSIDKFILSKRVPINAAKDADEIYKALQTIRSDFASIVTGLSDANKTNPAQDKIKFKDFSSLLSDYIFDASTKKLRECNQPTADVIKIEELLDVISLPCKGMAELDKDIAAIAAVACLEADKLSKTSPAVATLEEVKKYFISAVFGKLTDETSSITLRALLTKLKAYNIDTASTPRKLTNTGTATSLSITDNDADIVANAKGSGFVNVPFFKDITNGMNKFIAYLVQQGQSGTDYTSAIRTLITSIQKARTPAEWEDFVSSLRRGRRRQGQVGREDPKKSLPRIHSGRHSNAFRIPRWFRLHPIRKPTLPCHGPK